ncbi:hypothetical protein [Lyngbya sp. CCY1209]|uniref:hypothetical protein n=1 Tax=Lyngbya sp. CCY1209 TaxID=2886103 RepID=UPI002D20ADEE|nr:hypothetical protein [Lyngbya sp. CCY1209]MEB3884149.1 hypothetical protein [Lyngbya sp. CCY1209]
MAWLDYKRDRSPRLKLEGRSHFKLRISRLENRDALKSSEAIVPASTPANSASSPTHFVGPGNLNH